MNDRLESLRIGNLNLRVVCWCDRVSVLDGAKLWRLFAVRRWPSEISKVGEHLRCSVCRRHPTTIEPSSESPTVDPFPRDEDGWKRLVKRMRG